MLDPSTSTRATTPSSASGSLINLRDLDEQRLAIRNMARQTKSGGLLILAEGFTEGFYALNALRTEVGLPDVTPARSTSLLGH